MTTEDISAEELRGLYIGANLRQRYHVASQRIQYPSLQPNLLVNAVSALEGFARSVALHKATQGGEAVDVAYARLRNLTPIDLLTVHICPSFGLEPAVAFGNDAWSKLAEAVKCRNVLIHEAAFLNGKQSDFLTVAVLHIFETLGKIAGAA
jgi:hypothetical protein